MRYTMYCQCTEPQFFTEISKMTNVSLYHLIYHLVENGISGNWIHVELSTNGTHLSFQQSKTRLKSSLNPSRTDYIRKK